MQGTGVCLHACSLTNPACNAPPYYHLRPVWLRYIFLTLSYLINGTIFGENLLDIKCVFWFSLQVLYETFLTEENSVRYCHKCENVFLQITHYSYWILVKVEFSPERFSQKKAQI